MKTALSISMIFCFINVALFAQIQGIVVDNVTKKPIPYVSIWVENENNGTTAEENGEFSLNVSANSTHLLFSALGYEKKTVSIAARMTVELSPTTIELNEVVLTKKYGMKVIEIGDEGNSILQAYENGPRIDIKYFPYQPKYKKTKWIKQVVLNTDCRIEEAMLKLHFYQADEAGLPGDEILEKDFMVTVNKGVKKTSFNLSSLNLRMPKTGIFVGFERLKIEKNRFEKSILDANTQTHTVQTTFCPFVLYNQTERAFSYRFLGGKWEKVITTDPKGLVVKTSVYEPAINLILTN